MATNIELLAKIDALEARMAIMADPVKVAAHQRLIDEEGAPPSDSEISARHAAAERAATIASLEGQEMVDVILRKGWFPYHGHPLGGNPSSPDKILAGETDDDGKPIPVSVHKNMARAMVDAGVAEPANPFA